MSQMSWAIDPSGTMPLVPEPSRELGIVPRTLLSSTNSGLTSRFPPRRLPHASFWVQECEKKREEGWDAGKCGRGICFSTLKVVSLGKAASPYPDVPAELAVGRRFLAPVSAVKTQRPGQSNVLKCSCRVFGRKAALLFAAADKEPLTDLCPNRLGQVSRPCVRISIAQWRHWGFLLGAERQSCRSPGRYSIPGPVFVWRSPKP